MMKQDFGFPKHDGLSDEFIKKLTSEIRSLNYKQENYWDMAEVLGYTISSGSLHGQVVIYKDDHSVSLTETHSAWICDALNKANKRRRELKAAQKLVGTPFEGL